MKPSSRAATDELLTLPETLGNEADHALNSHPVEANGISGMAVVGKEASISGHRRTNPSAILLFKSHAVVRPERRVRPADGKSVRVSAGAPGSKPQAEEEIPTARAGRRNPLKERNKQAGRDI